MVMYNRFPIIPDKRQIHGLKTANADCKTKDHKQKLEG